KRPIPGDAPPGRRAASLPQCQGAFAPVFFLPPRAGFFSALGLASAAGFALAAVLDAVFLAGARRPRLGVFFTLSRKNTEQPGKVSETLCSQPCMGTSWVLMALPLVTPPPPNAVASEVNTSAQVP